MAANEHDPVDWTLFKGANSCGYRGAWDLNKQLGLKKRQAPKRPLAVQGDFEKSLNLIVFFAVMGFFAWPFILFFTDLFYS